MPDTRKPGRYLVGQKLSDYQFEKLIQAYAEGLYATEAASTPKSGGYGRDANTTTRVFGLLRKRLLEINYYLDPHIYLEEYVDPLFTMAHQGSGDDPTQWAPLMLGGADETALERAAEILFRTKNPHMTAGALARDIKLAIKVTGPLNRPASNIELWNEHLMLIFQKNSLLKLRYRIAEFHKDHPDAPDYIAENDQRFIAYRQEDIAYAQKQLNRYIRANRKAKAQTRKT